MESFSLLLNGMAIALEPQNLLFAVIGCVVGTAVGVLPGLGPVAATAMLLPVTAALEPIPAIIMLAAIFYGAMYGGTITSVLVNVPGEAASVITCLDGHEMAKAGRGGAALAIAAIGSFIGGTAATICLVLLAQPLSRLGLRFGPPEFFSLLLMGLALVIGLGGKSLARTLASALVGLFIAMIGIDPVAGAPRYTFGVLDLMSGIHIAVLAMGIFGISEVMLTVEQPSRRDHQIHVGRTLPTRDEWRRSQGPIVRGTLIGFFLGIIPGVSAVIASLTSYAAERRLSRTPERFGKGAVEGVAGPETANNAHANAALIPLFALGIPGSSTVAVLMGAFMMYGLQPGPFLFRDHPDVAWSVIASLYVGNIILLVLNLPLIPLWVKIMRIPRAVLMAAVVGFCIIGAYSLQNNVFDIGLLAVFGALGYVMRKLDFPIAPLVLAAVLGTLLERALRQSLEMSRGDFMVFVDRPIALVLMIIAVVVLSLSGFQAMAKLRGLEAEA